ncbi:hypothetical protein LSAT2_001668 [Lamellibrachia satsuma]|nr:hypothetical protein LSAT2_001668 [Lamellibrachia satsuma]
MSSSLEDLFGQILHSEQKAHERRTLINQVKNEVAKTHEKITEVQEELTSLRGKLVLKLQQWNDAQLQLKSSCLHQTILSAQKEELLQAHYTLQKQVVDISRNIDIARQTFCKDVQDFTTSYDLCSSGTHQRELQAKDELRKLCAEEQSLNADLSSYKERQTELEALSRGKEKYLAQLQETREKLAGDQITGGERI